MATTDRDGRVSIPRGFADGLVILRLIAGRSEPLREVPVMPGESDEELTIPIDSKAQAVTLETQLDALRDEIVDVVAVRNRLERKMKAREQGDDWAGVEEILVEFRKLPPRDKFVKRLEGISEDAAKQEEPDEVGRPHQDGPGAAHRDEVADRALPRRRDVPRV